jgi:hypothetical protein
MRRNGEATRPGVRSSGCGARGSPARRRCSAISGKWREVGWSDGGVDWEWNDETTYNDEARRLMSIRAMVNELIELIEVIDDQIAAQREIGALLN